MPNAAQIHQLYADDQHVESPGEEFKLTSYIRDLTRAGVAVHVGAAMGTLMALAGHANKQRECWPKQATLAEETGFSLRSVANHLDALVAVGAIHKVKLPVDAGQRGKWRNGYQLAPVSNIIAVCERTERDRMQNPARGRELPHAESCTRPCATLGNSEEAHIYMEVNKEEVTKIAADGDAAASLSSQEKSKRKRETVCKSPEEERDREDFLKLFAKLMHSFDYNQIGRYRNEALRGIRMHGYDMMVGCMRAMATHQKFVGKDYVSPVKVSNNVLTWEDARCPRRWQEVEAWAQRKAQRQAER